MWKHEGMTCVDFLIPYLYSIIILKIPGYSRMFCGLAVEMLMGMFCFGPRNVACVLLRFHFSCILTNVGSRIEVVICCHVAFFSSITSSLCRAHVVGPDI